jgi:predicted phage terminase large subunit-like protein
MHLEAVTRGLIRNLIINIPPGWMKSLTTSVYWPAWEWAQNPHYQYICTSADKDLVLRDSRRCREVMESEWYRAHFLPKWSFKAKGSFKQDSKGYFVNTAGGFRLSKAMGQKIIGHRGHRLIIDDPLDAKDAENDKKALVEHVRHYDTALSTRKNTKDAPEVVIMQRLHERDLTGHLLAQGGWEHLCIPNEYDGRRGRTSIGWEDPRTEEGELAFPALTDAEETARLKKKLGPTAYAAQEQQLPAPAEGATFKEKTFQYWTPETRPPRFDKVAGFWDCTFGSTSDDADYVVGQTWGSVQALRYLLDQVRRRMAVPQMIDAIREQRRFWPNMQFVVVENKAKGKKVIETLQREIPGLRGFNPQGTSKEGRAHAVTPLYHAHQVYFPHPDYFGWVKDLFLPEVLRFPHARHDDQVDTMTMALLELSPDDYEFASLGNVEAVELDI